MMPAHWLHGRVDTAGLEISEEWREQSHVLLSIHVQNNDAWTPFQKGLGGHKDLCDNCQTTQLA